MPPRLPQRRVPSASDIRSSSRGPIPIDPRRLSTTATRPPGARIRRISWRNATRAAASCGTLASTAIDGALRDAQPALLRQGGADVLQAFGRDAGHGLLDVQGMHGANRTREPGHGSVMAFVGHRDPLPLPQDAPRSQAGAPARSPSRPGPARLPAPEGASPRDLRPQAADAMPEGRYALGATLFGLSPVSWTAHFGPAERDKPARLGRERESLAGRRRARKHARPPEQGNGAHRSSATRFVSPSRGSAVLSRPAPAPQPGFRATTSMNSAPMRRSSGAVRMNASRRRESNASCTWAWRSGGTPRSSRGTRPF